LIIDALDAASTSLTVATSVGGAGTNLNLDKLLEAKKLMDAGNVPMEGRHILIHANNLSALLGETEVTSSDYNSVKALVSGDVNTFLGFNFHVIGDRDEGGLPKPSTRTCYAWHQGAVGYAEGMGIRTEINYIPEKTSHLVASMFSAGAVGIDAEGIVEIACTE
jgi:hypothetical protein